MEDYTGSSKPWEQAEKSTLKALDLYNKDDYENALTSLEEALSSNPCNSSWLFNKGLILDSLNRFQDAIAAFQQADELNPEDPQILNSIGIDYTRTHQYDSALKIFEGLERIATDFEPAYCNRIILYLEKGMHDEAETMFYLARQFVDECPLCYYNLGISLFARGLYDRAIFCWEKTKSIEPEHPEISYVLGQAYWKNGQKDKSKECFLAELQKNEINQKVLLSYSLLLLEMGELEQAEGTLRLILNLKPNDEYAHHYMGELSLHKGDTQGAIKEFKEALNINPELEGVNYRLGQCYLKLGMVDNARMHLLKEINRCPNNSDLLLELGASLYEADLISIAIPIFERAMDLSQNDPRIHHNLSCCYYFDGLLGRGIEFSLSALEKDSRHFPSLQNLIHAYLSSGDLENARRYIREISHLQKSSGLKLEYWISRLHNQVRIRKDSYTNIAEKMRRILKVEHNNIMWYPFYYVVAGKIGESINLSFLPPMIVKKGDWRT